jgi:hypothetical protein
VFRQRPVSVRPVPARPVRRALDERPTLDYMYEIEREEEVAFALVAAALCGCCNCRKA